MPIPPPIVTLKPRSSSVAGSTIAMKPRQCAKTSTSFIGGTAIATLNLREGTTCRKAAQSLARRDLRPFSSFRHLPRAKFHGMQTSRGFRCLDTACAKSRTSSPMLEKYGFGVAMTLRHTSPQAASVSMRALLISRIVDFRFHFRTPCNWYACLVVSRYRYHTFGRVRP